MEIRINKEIKDYKESVFWGLSLKQCVCSVLAVVVSAVGYITLKHIVGGEVAVYVCICAAAPFAALGFVKYHGMTAEKLLWAWLRSEVIEPKRLGFRANNIYYEAQRPTIEKLKREVYERHEDETKE